MILVRLTILVEGWDNTDGQTGGKILHIRAYCRVKK
jgi:hypothetical protein